MGATAAAFTVLGHERLSAYQIMPERLVMISPPSGIFRMVEHFCLHSGQAGKVNELAKGLENDFDFSMKNFQLSDIIGSVKSRLLIIHDEDDEEIPVSDALSLKKSHRDAELLLTKGAGHQRILFSRDALRGLKDFLS
jgi:pimeloyl-ACP methyl ester carboxylesterase